MSTTRNRLFAAAAVACAAVFVALVMGSTDSTLVAPFKVATRCPWGVLAEDAHTLHGCLDCHEGQDLHTCTTCHDEHGDAVLTGVEFDEVVDLVGDVPAPGPVAVAQIVPRDATPPGGMPLLDFLASHGVESFERVALFSGDGSQVEIARDELSPSSLLMPHTDGVRFADEQHHYSTWLKGLTRIVVVGSDRPLRLGDQQTSIGRLLLQPTRSVTVEGTEVMLAPRDGGPTRQARTATRLQGIPLTQLLPNPGPVTVLDGAGGRRALDADAVEDALLVQEPGGLTMVFEARGRAAWITGVVAVDEPEAGS